MNDSKSFKATLQTNGEWITQDLETDRHEQIIELTSEGLSQHDIAAELEVDKSTVCRHVKRARREGRLD